ncbi:alpha/beta hydrolase family esterase [Mycolicibacterium arenosum]|uniref:Prolyl oligopeptidase family serine peptidase n=1 Tax=Mycolicibacterium arenosum TaxID=2952157 RepID=A0ABT1MAC0_9MYCO|nr:PHB depolymerase family esterase [Mycolicibacterium sp. CAU 1645]MCP9275342.1 prolyl oligopeptidase family serine peptidase [Mycolicibacterium sp. CAU 1645]
MVAHVARLILAVVLVLAGACAPGRAVADGSSRHTLAIAGLERDYRLYTPVGVQAPAPLVVMLHGGFGSAEQAERTYGWNALADREGFVVAYPDGVGRAWNAGGCCGRPARDGVDDVGFVGAVVDDVAARLPVDRRRVFAAGMSNGGMMAYALACGSDVFAAIGPVAATQVSDCGSPRPTAVVAIHGEADQSVRADGAPGAGIARVDGPPVADVDAFWRRVDACDAPVVDVAPPVTTSAADCAEGRGVTLISVAGAGHQWPGSQPVREGADPPSGAVDATQTLWAFFAAHPAAG